MDLEKKKILFSKFLKERREFLGITQSELAKEMHCKNCNFVSQFENYQKSSARIPPDKLLKLVSILKLGPATVLAYMLLFCPEYKEIINYIVNNGNGTISCNDHHEKEGLSFIM